MSKFIRLIVPCAVMVLCSQGLYAQNQLLSIEEMFRLADENSRSIQIYSTGREIADEALKAAKAQRLPELNVSLSASYLGNGRLWERDFSNGMNIEMPHFGNNFAVEASQVIYAGGAIEAGIGMAELGKKMADLDWQKNRQEILFLLTGQYLDLYKLDNSIKVLEQNLQLTEQVLEEMRVRREAGTVLKNDITRYELQREHISLQLIKVRDARTVINFQLVTTLHLPEGATIVPDTTLLRSQVETLAESDWQELATGSSIHLQQAQTAIALGEQQVKAERSAMLPQIAVVAADHLDGPITIEVPVLNNNFNYWYVGLGIKYDISALYKSNRNVRKAKLDVRRSQETFELAQEQVETAVQAAYTNFMTSFAELGTQQVSVRLAEENYSVTSNRYLNDMALLTDLLDATNTKLNAELSLVNARINVIYSYYKMKYITHTL